MEHHSSSRQSLSILLIEDSKGNAILIQRELERAMAESYTVTHVLSMGDALKALAAQHFDIALLDRSLPDTHEFSGLHSIQNMAPDVPIIYLTGYQDEHTALESIRQGAQDYVFKDHLDGNALKRAIQYAILRKEYETVLRVQANFDKLTGLSNRMMFENRLDIALAKTQRHNYHVAVIFLDVDRFKAINDTLGHAAGDAVLIEVGSRLNRILRPYDTLARFGGDEFAILIEELDNTDSSNAVAQKIVDLFIEPLRINGSELHVDVSLGIASCNAGESKSRECILLEADEAMYRAKGTTGSFYVRYSKGI